MKKLLFIIISIIFISFIKPSISTSYAASQNNGNSDIPQKIVFNIGSPFMYADKEKIRINPDRLLLQLIKPLFPM